MENTTQNTSRKPYALMDGNALRNAKEAIIASMKEEMDRHVLHMENMHIQLTIINNMLDDLYL